MTEEKLKAALIQAHNKGDKQAAQLFASKIKELRAQVQAQPNGFNAPPVGTSPDAYLQQPNAPQPKRDLSIGESIIGAGEVGLSALSSATTGLATGVAGGLQGAIGDLAGVYTPQQAEEIAARSMEAGTYQPRTEAGRRIGAAVGAVASALPPVIAGFSPTQVAGAGQALKATARGASLPTMPAKAAGAQGDLSVGAAQVAPDVARRNLANELPIPMGDKLTKGMVTQDRNIQNFEIETAKNPELGAPLVQRMDELNLMVNQNIDEMIEMTGTQLPETDWRLQTGNKVISALKKGYDAESAKVSTAYKAAADRGETKAQLPQDKVDTLAEFVNDNRAKRTNAPVLKGFVDEVKVKELGEGSIEDGTFKLKPMTIEQSETLRQEINRLADSKNGQDLFYAGQLKKLIDQAQDGAGGQSFQSARKMRGQMARKYENLAIIDQLLDTKGSYADQRIASEQIFNRAILNGSIEDVRNLRRVLSTAGQDGIDALTEVRAATLRHLRDEATRNIGRAPDGTPRVSPKGLDNAVKALDKNGKLNILFGKDANKIRTLNEVTKDIFVGQPNTANTSNTAANVLAAIDMMVSAGVSAPAPILSVLRMTAKSIKDKKIKKRIEESLK